MTQPPMFSRTGSADFPSYLKCMISGPPKSGKTTLLGTVPNIIIADTEPHANNLQSIAHLDVPFKAINGTNDLRQLQFVLSQEALRKQSAEALGMPDVQAVAIDTVDTLQMIMKRERMKEQRSTQFMRDDWGWLKEEMISILESYLALPMHVFFVVHTKTKDVGTEKNPRTVILPGLEGAIAESIAGMVGYSLLSFRKEEVKADGSGKYTKYWLRAEGDETYEYLGNRAAGRLPDIIEPDFQHLLDAAMAGRPTKQQPQVQMPLEIQTTGQMQPAPAAQAQQAPQQAPTPAAEPAAQTPPAPAAPAPTAVAPATPPGDDEPVNAAALSFVKKVYDAIGQPMPEEKIKALNLGQARNIVRTFKALQQDAAENKLGEGTTPATVMTEFLGGQDWLGGEAAAPVAPVEPKLDGNIKEVQAYATDITKVQEAYDLEVQRPGGGRVSLVDWLVRQGALVRTAVESTSVPAAPESDVPQAPQPAAPAPSEAPSQAPTPVTPAEAVVDVPPTEEQAVATAREGLGAEVISQGVNADALCEECGNTIDDVDLAQLGKSRFDRILCVTDYIAETKKSKLAAAQA